MKIRERQTSHMIDFLFPLALFFCFAVSAIVLILMATGIYRSTTESSARNHVGRTALAYVSEKLHQGDANGDVFIGALGEEPALVLRRQSDGGTYCTYIYEYEGALRELFLKEGAEVPPENGSVIAEIEAFSDGENFGRTVLLRVSGGVRRDTDAAGQCAQPECRRDRL